LDSVKTLNFLFGEPTFIKSIDPDKTNKRDFKIEKGYQIKEDSRSFCFIFNNHGGDSKINSGFYFLLRLPKRLPDTEKR